MLRVFFALLALTSAASAADLVPLDELGTGTYLSFRGGLYENGSSPAPPDHLAAGLLHALQVVPRDREGQASSSGKIVMISIGMSNTTQEFCATSNPAPCTSWSFVGQSMSDPAVNHETLIFVNGAAGGKAADSWDSPTDPDYNRVRDTDLAPLGLTEAQVQVAWVKVANPQPTASLPSSNADAYRLQTQMGNIARALKVRYPNIQIVYFSSRIYAGYATSTLNPEPYAYESGLAVKWVIDAQVQQRRSGRVIDSRAGDLSDNSVAPWIAWGPYLWRDGAFWLRADFEGDGTHPSQSGEQKVGALLLQFFNRNRRPSDGSCTPHSRSAAPRATDCRTELDSAHEHHESRSPGIGRCRKSSRGRIHHARPRSEDRIARAGETHALGQCRRPGRFGGHIRRNGAIR